MADAPPPPLDEYERKYMGGSTPLARSRVAVPLWMHVFLGGVTLFLLATGVAALPQTILPLLIVPLFALLWLFLMFLRVTVTPEAVHIQYGVFGPRIPMSAITDVRAETYQPIEYGGWGIKHRSGGGWAYSVPGGEGRGILVTYRTKRGRERQVFASSDRPDELVAAIAKARGAQVRVAAEPGAVAGARIAEEEVAGEPSERAGRHKTTY
jgi:hypothetical protein